MPQGSKSDPLPEQTNCYKPEPYHTFDQVLLRWLSCLGCALHAVVGGGGVARALVAVFFQILATDENHGISQPR